jgi:hypothetical protein
MTPSNRRQAGSILVECVGGIVLTGVVLATLALGLANISLQRKSAFRYFVAQQSLANALEDIDQLTNNDHKPSQLREVKLDAWAVQRLPDGKLVCEEATRLIKATDPNLKAYDVSVTWIDLAGTKARQSVTILTANSTGDERE